MRCLDAPLLSSAAPLLSRVWGQLGLKHWQINSCIDALFAGSLILFVLVFQKYWLLFAFPAYATLPSVRKAEFLSLEEAADLTNQPMRNLRQEMLPFCCFRYGSYLVYACFLADCFWLGTLDSIAVLPPLTGILKALTEAIDVYPTGTAARRRHRLFLPTEIAKSST